jgi:hypothetical protein
VSLPLIHVTRAAAVAAQVTAEGSTLWAVTLGGDYRDMEPAVAVSPSIGNSSTTTVYLAGSFRSQMRYNGARSQLATVSSVVPGTEFRDLFLATVKFNVDMRSTCIRVMQYTRILSSGAAEANVRREEASVVGGVHVQVDAQTGTVARLLTVGNDAVQMPQMRWAPKVVAGLDGSAYVIASFVATAYCDGSQVPPPHELTVRVASGLHTHTRAHTPTHTHSSLSHTHRFGACELWALPGSRGVECMSSLWMLRPAAPWRTDTGEAGCPAGCPFTQYRLLKSVVVRAARSQAAGSRSVTSHGGFDVLLLKVDGTGSVAWCVAFGGAGADTGRALAVGFTRSSAEDNTTTEVLYAGGQFRDTATFGDRVLTAEAVADGFVLKVNPTTGGVLWARRVGGAGGADQVDALAMGLDNTITAVGSFSGSLSVPGMPRLQSDGDTSDVFVLRVRAHLNSPHVLNNPWPLSSAPLPNHGWIHDPPWALSARQQYRPTLVGWICWMLVEDLSPYSARNTLTSTEGRVLWLSLPLGNPCRIKLRRTRSI